MGEVGDEGLADIDGQRETFDAAALAVHHELAGPPVDVVELQPGDLGGPQTETGQQDQHGVVTKPWPAWNGRSRPGCAATSAAGIVAGREVPRQPATGGTAPANDDGIRPVDVQEAQQRAQLGDATLERTQRLAAVAFVKQEPGHVRPAQPVDAGLRRHR